MFCQQQAKNEVLFAEKHPNAVPDTAGGKKVHVLINEMQLMQISSPHRYYRQ